MYVLHHLCGSFDNQQTLTPTWWEAWICPCQCSPWTLRSQGGGFRYHFAFLVKNKGKNTCLTSYRVCKIQFFCLLRLHNFFIFHQIVKLCISVDIEIGHEQMTKKARWQNRRPRRSRTEFRKASKYPFFANNKEMYAFYPRQYLFKYSHLKNVIS